MDIDPFPEIVSLLPLTLKSYTPKIPSSLPQVGRITTLKKQSLVPSKIMIKLLEFTGIRIEYSVGSQDLAS